jgi:hypothetical protein
MSKGPRSGRITKKRKSRWIIIFEGPARDLAYENIVRLLMTSEESHCRVYPSAAAARKNLQFHIMRPFATWLFELNSGDAEVP